MCKGVVADQELKEKWKRLKNGTKESYTWTYDEVGQCRVDKILENLMRLILSVVGDYVDAYQDSC